MSHGGMPYWGGMLRGPPFGPSYDPWDPYGLGLGYIGDPYAAFTMGMITMGQMMQLLQMSSYGGGRRGGRRGWSSRRDGFHPRTMRVAGGMFPDLGGLGGLGGLSGSMCSMCYMCSIFGVCPIHG